MKESEQIKNLMLSLLKQVGLFLENKFYSFKNVYDKNVSYIVDNFANQAEEMIINKINSEFPNHQIVSSKKPNLDLLNNSDNLWIINALDGFSHFSRNIPIYTINLAFQYQGEVIFGAVNYQSAKQLFLAEKNKGAILNGLAIQTSKVEELKKAYIFLELPKKEEDFDFKMDKVKELIKASKQVEIFRIGALGQCLVAAGAFDVYIDFSGTSTIYNQLASKLIVEEAGCKVVNLDEPTDENIRFLVSNKNLIKEIEKII